MSARNAEVFSKMLILGTYAFMFPQQDIARRSERGDPTTHEWTCLLRTRDPNEDLSSVVRKVVFTLHPSFPQPQRVVEQAPFEVSEVGWGEFEISARIYLIDSEEKPLEMRHTLKLYPDNTLDIRQVTPPTQFRELCVPAETYDEIIFRSPSEKLKQALQHRKFYNHPLREYFLSPPDEAQRQYQAIASELRKHLLHQQDSLKSDIIKRSQELQSLMEMHYCLHPERALQVMLAKPELLTQLVVPGSINAQTLASTREQLKKILSSPSPLLLNREKVTEVLDLFQGLVKANIVAANGLILPNAGS